VKTLTCDIKCGKAKMDEFCLWNYVCMEVDGWNVLVVLWEVGGWMKCCITNENIHGLWMNGWRNGQIDEQMDDVVKCEKHSFIYIKCGKAK
jgi:hypothetical protein